MANRISELAYWIRAREAIRCLKEAGVPPPWSQDKAMTTVRYCNIRREDDKVTRWLKENWRDPYADHPNLIPAMVLARMINWPETLQAIGFPVRWDPNRLIDMLVARSQTGRKVWSSAYMITTCGKRMGKEQYVVDVATSVWNMGFVFASGRTTLHDAHTALTSIDGLGSFLAGQVVADLKNIPSNPLGVAPDWWTWCASGPGSKRGLNLYFEHHPEAAMSERAFREWIKVCYDEVAPQVEPYVDRLHMQDFQNCLCEFSKFIRFKAGGKVRNRYVAREDAY